MACSSACPDPGSHESFGACLRAKNLKTAVSIPGNGWDRSAQSRWDRRIDSYRTARAQGIEPTGTKQSQIDAAVQHSDKTGTAFKAGGAA